MNDVASRLFLDLRNGHTFLEALNNISRKSSTSQILSQTTSTFTLTLDFPKEEQIFIEPSFFINQNGQTKSQAFEELKKSLKEDFGIVYRFDPSWKSKRQTILSAAPGMGKTKVTMELGKWLGCATGYLVVLLQIHLFVDFFLKNSPNDNYAIVVLDHALKDVESKRKTLKSKLETKEVFLLVDGFDECCQNLPLKNRVITFIKKYLGYQCPLWITTRPHEHQELKKIMDKDIVQVLGINPFNREDQTKLLKEKAHMAVGKCKDILEDFDQKWGTDLLSNPLHLCMMAELVKNKHEIVKTPLALYETFVNMKIKNALIDEGFSQNNIQDKINSRMITILKAVELTLKGKTASSLTEQEVKDINNVGLAIVTDNTISYYHQTYYEFFIAPLYLLPQDIRESSGIHIDTKEVFSNKDMSHIRKQIDNYYCETDGHLIKDEEHFISKLPSSPAEFLSAMDFICKEGLFNILAALLISEVTKDECEDLVRKYCTESFQMHGSEFLYNACCSNEELAKLFIDMGANLEEMVYNASINPVKLVALLNKVSSRNYTTLMQKIVEAGERHNNFVNALSSKHANNNLTALHSASANNNLKIVQLLVNLQGIDPNTVSNGLTPLGKAALNGSIDCFSYLLELCRTQTAHSTEPLLHIAAVKGHVNIVCILLMNGARTRIDEKAPFNFDLDCLEQMIFINGKTPLHLASQVGALGVVEKLVNEGANVNVRDDINDMTALHYAAQQESNDCLAFLMRQEGIEVDPITIRSRTPLHFACMVGNEKGLQMLINMQANIEARDCFKYTPLAYAMLSKKDGCFKILSQMKANTEPMKGIDELLNLLPDDKKQMMLSCDTECRQDFREYNRIGFLSTEAIIGHRIKVGFPFIIISDEYRPYLQFGIFLLIILKFPSTLKKNICSIFNICVFKIFFSLFLFEYFWLKFNYFLLVFNFLDSLIDPTNNIFQNNKVKKLDYLFDNKELFLLGLFLCILDIISNCRPPSYDYIVNIAKKCLHSMMFDYLKQFFLFILLHIMFTIYNSRLTNELFVTLRNLFLIAHHIL